MYYFCFVFIFVLITEAHRLRTSSTIRSLEESALSKHPHLSRTFFILGIVLGLSGPLNWALAPSSSHPIVAWGLALLCALSSRHWLSISAAMAAKSNAQPPTISEKIKLT